MNQYTTRLWAALLTISLLLSLTACGKDTTAATMHLKRTVGTVTVSDDAEKDVPLLENLSLYSGYGVDTGSESYAWISLDDVKLAKMDQESEIAINKEEKDLDIEVISGSLFFNITQPLEEDETMDIRTSTMLIGIRGTCGWVEERDGLSRVYLLEGTVECSAGGRTVWVNASEMAELTADGRLVVQPFTVRDISAFVQDDLAQDPDLCSDIYDASGLDVLGIAGGEEGLQSVGEPDFEKYGFSYVEAELGVAYPYKTICSQNSAYTTVGSFTFSDYEVFISDDTHEALDGFEWRAVTITFTFDDDNAWEYGYTWSFYSYDYYNMQEDGITKFNGIDYPEAEINHEVLEQEWNGDVATLVCRVYALVPTGYNGIIVTPYDHQYYTFLDDDSVAKSEKVMTILDNGNAVSFRMK